LRDSRAQGDDREGDGTPRRRRETTVNETQDRPTTDPIEPKRPPTGSGSNGIFVAIAVGIVLVIGGYWLMTALSDWNRLQVCATSGRRDCTTGR
jgi:hypothetical protein